jgi:hypothetical protein
MPFARFENFEACTLEMTKLGHDAESANKICGEIKSRAEKGILYKAESTGLEVLSKAGDPELYVGGNAGWDIEDDEGDIITAEAYAKGAQRFMSLAPEWQNITANHKEFRLAQPALTFTDSTGKQYFNHVHEKGWYLISKIRNDNLKTTQYYRGEVEKGNMDGYSITGVPLERDPVNPKRITDVEITSITLTQKGVMKPVNPMSRNVQVISRGADLAVINDEGKFIPLPDADMKYPNALGDADVLSIEAILAKHGFNKTIT